MNRIKNQEFDYSAWGISVSDQGEHMMIGQSDCVDLAKEYGTPLTIVNHKKLEDNYREFEDSLKGYPFHSGIFYSYKTNPIPGVINILHEWGAGACVISEYELWLALKLGVRPSKIVLNGLVKSDNSLKTALKKNIRLINVSSFEEIDKIGTLSSELNQKQKIGVRVTFGQRRQAQFGLSINNGNAFEAYRKLSQYPNLDICGIHFHLGTKINNTSIYEQSILAVIQFAKKLRTELRLEISILDIGGGFGVPTVRDYGRLETKALTIFNRPYASCHQKEFPVNRQFVETIIKSVIEACETNGMKPPELIIEPGPGDYEQCPDAGAWRPMCQTIGCMPQPCHYGRRKECRSIGSMGIP